MNGRQMQAWRRRLGWTQTVAAEMLGRGERSIQYYELDRQPIPREIWLACLALEMAAIHPTTACRALNWLGTTQPSTTEKRIDPCAYLRPR